MTPNAATARYQKLLRGKSGIRRFGWPLLGLGILIGGLGWFAVLMELTTEGDNVGLAALLAVAGTAIFNLGFFLALFGLIEDRILQSEAVILAQVGVRVPDA